MGDSAGVLWAHISDLIMSMSNKDKRQSQSFMCAGATGLTGFLGIPIAFKYTGTLQVGIAWPVWNSACPPKQCGHVSHKTSMIDPWHAQTFVAPLSTNYSITAVGAGGGAYNDGTNVAAGGTGANLTTIVTLNAGRTLDVVVGGMGGRSSGGSGGGGASFVFVPSASAPLIVAGAYLNALWSKIS